LNNEFLKQAALHYPDAIMMPYDIMMKNYGFESVLAMCDSFSGRSIYVPSARTIFSRCIELEAKKEFRGDVKELSQKFGFTERHMRRMLGNP